MFLLIFAILTMPFGEEKSFAQTSPEASVYKRKIQLELEVVQGAIKYEIKINDLVKKETILEEVTKQTDWSTELAPGKYQMMIRSFDQRGVPGEWQNPDPFTIEFEPTKIVSPKRKEKFKAENKQMEIPIKFEWNTKTPIAKFELIVSSKDEKFKKTEIVEGFEKTLNVPAGGIYKWTINYSGVPAELLPRPAKGIFAIVGSKLDTPIVNKPTKKFFEEISWIQDEHAQTSSFYLQRKNQNGKWIVVDKNKNLKDPKINLKKQNPGLYRITVRSKAPGFVASDVTKMEFNFSKDTRSPAAIKEAELKESLDRPTSYYFIASYLITQINYNNRSLEENTGYTFDVVGGTGRLGLGWQEKDNALGVYSIVDLSGFNLGSNNFNFYSAEIHLTWTFSPFKVDRLILSGGIYNRQLPMIISRGGDQFDVDTAEQLGYHAGLNYWRPFSKNYGIQVVGRLYQGVSSGKTPSGSKPNPELSILGGILGSYRFSNSWMGFVGYQYRQDNMSFPATTNNTSDPNASNNEIEYSGHYLNLKMEIPF